MGVVCLYACLLVLSSELTYRTQRREALPGLGLRLPEVSEYIRFLRSPLTTRDPGSTTAPVRPRPRPRPCSRPSLPFARDHRTEPELCDPRSPVRRDHPRRHRRQYVPPPFPSPPPLLIPPEIHMLTPRPDRVQAHGGRDRCARAVLREAAAHLLPLRVGRGPSFLLPHFPRAR